MTNVLQLARPTCPTCGQNDEAVKKQGLRWYCHRCKAPLPGREEAPAPEPISRAFVDACHERLMKSPTLLDWLSETRHISLETVKRFKLGTEGGRVLIPIPNGESIVNIRCAKPGEKLRPIEKNRSVQLFPGKLDATPLLMICEGEWDMLAATSLGYSACSGTGGAGVFHATWATEIQRAAERVVIAYDADHAGRTGARRVAERLIDAGMRSSQIQALHLPLIGAKDEKDLTDWIRLGGTREALDELIAGTQTWEQFDLPTGAVPEEAPHRTLAEAGDKAQAWAWSWFPASVVTLVMDAYQLPKKISLNCPQDQGKLCGTCQMVGYVSETPMGEAPVLPVDITSDRFVEHLGTPKFKLREQVLASVGVQPKCPTVELDYVESIPVQEGRISDTLTVDSDHRASERSAIFVDLEDVIASNQDFEMLGRFMPHPRDQVWTAVVHRARGVDQVVENFEENTKVLRALKKKNRKLDATVQALLRDSEEITGIRGRPDMHLLIWLSLCSTLQLVTTDREERGWLDVALLGDTSEGKSCAVERIQEYVGLGTVIALKQTTTRAGLFGGVVQERKKNVISWGVMPRSDRRWLWLDEAHNVGNTLISAMTSARSKGIAETYMAGVAAFTPCRVRLGWGMNCPCGFSVSEHAYGIDVVSHCFKRPEDIRRLDAALIISRGEVPTEAQQIGGAKEPKLLTRELAEHLVVRAWAQRGMNVEHLLPVADEWRMTLSRKFVDSPPVLKASDLPWKLLRLGTALANLVGADRPEAEHVEYMARWLDKVYSSDVCGFAALSALERTRESLADESLVWRALEGTGNVQVAVELLLLQPDWSSHDFAALVPNGDPMLGGALLSSLVRNRAMVREGRFYRKSRAFTNLLREKQRCP